METVVGILLGLGIASVCAFSAILLWTAWRLKASVSELRSFLSEMSKFSSASASMAEAVPVFKKLSEQGDRIHAGLLSVNSTIKRFSAMAFKAPEEETVQIEHPAHPAGQARSEGKVYSTDESAMAEREVAEGKQDLHTSAVPSTETTAEGAEAIRRTSF